jgi:hypothetical protein
MDHPLMAALGAAGVNGGVSNKGLVLAAMVFAVAMTFIDPTIVDRAGVRARARRQSRVRISP